MPREDLTKQIWIALTVYAVVRLHRAHMNNQLRRATAMTEPTDIDALETLYRNNEERPAGLTGRDHVLALIAELRQERERADKNEQGWGVAFDIAHRAQDDLTRAREVIEKAKAHEWSCFGDSDTHRILATYDQKGSSDG